MTTLVNGSGRAIDWAVLESFRLRVRGVVIPGDDDRYENARKLWNAMIDKRPGLIVQCADAADIKAAVTFAREHNLSVAVRGGGHSVAGKSSCDGGLVIDLSHMKEIVVDPSARLARAQPGLRWAEFDRVTQAYGLATTGGVVSHTGIAGLTLGGGIGWLAHAFGLSCDQLISASIVTAAGEALTASAHENADLFWGIRGAGANLGVVTSFEYRLYPVDGIIGGLILYPFKQGRDGLKFYREYSQQTPHETGTAAALLTTPDGEKMFAIIVCYHGPSDASDRVLKPLREFRSPTADLIAPIPYAKMQTLLDEAMAPGMRSYWRSHLLTRIDDELIETTISKFAEVPSARTAVIFQQIGGAVKEIPNDATAFSHRNAEYDFVVLSLWSNAEEDDRNIRWTRELGTLVAPFASGGVYVNNLTADDQARVRLAYGSNYERLVALKGQFDPANLFRSNQNIQPTLQGLNGPECL